MVEISPLTTIYVSSNLTLAPIKPKRKVSMIVVKLKDFGTSLGSRVLGKEVSNMIDFEKEDKIILDFQDVKMVTSSFADEVVGKNCAKLGLHNFFDKVQIVNTSEQIKLILKKAIMDRLHELNSH